MTNQKPKIVVSEKLKKKLDKLGKKGDTYEDIIWKLCSTKREVSELKPSKARSDNMR